MASVDTRDAVGLNARWEFRSPTSSPLLPSTPHPLYPSYITWDCTPLGSVFARVSHLGSHLTRIPHTPLGRSHSPQVSRNQSANEVFRRPLPFNLPAPTSTDVPHCRIAVDMDKVDHNDAEGVVLEAGGQLFTVNRCRLVQASIMFRDMFEIARDESSGNQDGTVETPIPTGDDADGFRDFLWAMRVRPGELTQFLRSPASPEKATKLINIARLSHKYQDSALCDWALEQLRETLTPMPATFPLKGPVLIPLLSTISLFKEDDEGAKAIISLLRQRVEESMSAGKSNPIDLVGLVQACTNTGCTSLLPIAYYAILVSPSASPNLIDPRLTASNKHQLLLGAYYLTEAWHTLQLLCPAAYVRHVMEKQRFLRPADLLGKLKAVSTENFTSQRVGYVTQYNDASTGTTLDHAGYEQAKTWTKTKVEDMIKTFPDKLAGYFSIAATSTS